MSVVRQALNFVLEVVVDFVPGGWTVRPWLHRLRGVSIGSGTFISRRVVLETKRPERIVIGSNVFIGIGTTVIAHHDTSEDMSGVDVIIGDGVYVGPHCVVLPGVTVGENSVVAAGSVVNKSVKPNMLVRGNPCVKLAEITVPLGAGGEMTAFVRGLRHHPVKGPSRGNAE